MGSWQIMEGVAGVPCGGARCPGRALGGQVPPKGTGVGGRHVRARATGARLAGGGGVASGLGGHP